MPFEIYENVGQLNKILDVITRRQEMSVHNVANARTPGYTAKSVPFDQMLAQAMAPMETPLTLRMGSTLLDVQSTGKPVVMEQELVEMQKMRIAYTLGTRTINKAFAALRTATQAGR
jgi:flagellar basal body rod protein FlgB